MPKRVGLVFGAFSLILLVWNIITPLNEDHIVNIVEHSFLVLMFSFSILIKNPFNKYLQVSSLFVGSWIAGALGELQASAAVGTVAVILTYGYNAFQPLSKVVIIGAFVVQLLGVSFAALRAEYPLAVAFGHGLVWTLLPLVGVWLYWELMQLFSKVLIAQNRELLEINKSLMSGGCDGSKEA